MINNLNLGRKLKLLNEWDNTNLYGTLVSLEGNEHVSEPFKYKLNLITGNKDIIKQNLCNKAITFCIETYTNGKLKSKKLFNGIVIEVNFIKLIHTQSSPDIEYEYVLKVVPKLCQLQKVKRSKVYYKEKQTVIDVIEEVLKENNIEYRLSVKNPALFITETCIQYNESDFQFLTRLLQAAGLFYFFDHTESLHNMVISNQASSYLDMPNKNVELLNNDGTFLSLHSISFQYSSYVEEFSTKAFSYPKPGQLVDKQHSNTTHKKQEDQRLASEQAVYLKEINNTDQVSQLTQNFAACEQALSEQISGTGNYTDFCTGGKFKLSGEFFDNIDQKEYVIISIKFRVYDYLTSAKQYENEFIAIPHNIVYVPPKIFHKPVISVLHHALVVDREGKEDSAEPYCDDKGCVYIKLLWSNNSNFCKANILSSSNSCVLPRTGSLAYVLFPHNDLYNDIPVVVGLHNQGLINFKDKEEWYKNIYMVYPESGDSSVYNFISFKDKKDEQEINIQARKDIVYNVENDETTTIKKDSKKYIKEGNLLIKTEKGKMVIESCGPIEIETKEDFNIKSSGKITLEASKGIELKSSADITLDSSKNINNKAAMATKYESGTSLEVKANVGLTLTSTVTKIEGKANLNISSPLTKIGM